MTAAKVIDIKSRLPGCAGQAVDAVSACTQVKMEDCTDVTENSKVSIVQIFGYVYQNTNCQKSWSSMEDPVALLERNLYGHPLAGLL